jgi:hypothetical protein
MYYYVDLELLYVWCAPNYPLQCYEDVFFMAVKIHITSVVGYGTV